jgi:hypothetical protein
MMNISKVITRITLDMSNNSKNPSVYAKQGDRATRYVIATLQDNGVNYNIPSGSSVVLNAVKPDGACVYNSCTYSGAEVTMELTSQLLAVSGTATCDIEVRSSDGVQLITSATFLLSISKSLRNDSAIESTDEFTAFEQDLMILSEEITASEKATKEAQVAKESADIATLNANSAAKSATTATTKCENATKKANDALQSQEQLDMTLESVTEINKNVMTMYNEIAEAREQVSSDKAEIDETVKNSLLESSLEILNSVKDYFGRAESLYNSLYIDIDGGNCAMRRVNILNVDCGTCATRKNDNGIFYDGGDCATRLLGK